MYSIREFGFVQSLPGNFRSNDVTSGSLPITWGHVVIYCHVTTSSCKLQPCRKWNLQCTRVFGLLQPLAGDFRSNDVTSGSLPVTWGHEHHLLSCDCLLLRATALYKVKSTVYASFRPSRATSRWLPAKWRHFQVTW